MAVGIQVPSPGLDGDAASLIGPCRLGQVRDLLNILTLNSSFEGFATRPTAASMHPAKFPASLGLHLPAERYSSGVGRLAELGGM